MAATPTYTNGAPFDTADLQLARSDRVMRALIRRLGPVKLPEIDAPSDLFGALVMAIVRQQLAANAATAIYNRLVEYLGGHPPTPEAVLSAGPELRTTAGLSHAKELAVRDLAQQVADGTLDLGGLPSQPDDEVLRMLTSVRGIGEWTAGVFMMFRLGRQDVLLAGDLGIRKAAQQAYALEALPSTKTLVAIAEPWRPYRTRACLYLWGSLRGESAPA